MNFYNVLMKKQEGVSHFERLFMKYRAGGGATEKELEGVPPLTFNANGEPLISWTIYGNMQQTGTPSPSSIIMPDETGDKTANLLEKLTLGYTLNQSGEPVQYTVEGGISRMATITPINVTNLTSITLSYEKAPSYSGFCMYSTFNGSTLIERVAQKISPCTIDVSNATSLYISIYAGSTDVNVTSMISNVMLNTGSTALPYQPYGFKLPVQCGGVVTPVYTAEPLRKIGEYTDYKSESAEYRAIGKLMLDGTIPLSARSGEPTGVYFKSCADLGIAPVAYEVVCSHFQKSNTNRVVDMVDNTVLLSASTLYIRYTGTNDINAWLSENPVTVWYVLGIPTTATVEAPEIPTVNGSNTFDVDTTLKPSKAYIKYYG